MRRSLLPADLKINLNIKLVTNEKTIHNQTVIMKLIDNTLYLSIQEVVDCGITTANYLSKAKSEGTNAWNFIDDPADKRKVLIGYEDMKPAYQKLVWERFGNPYEMVARKPILDMVVQDSKANEYYKQYRYEDSKYLPIATVNKYTRAASWLNMLATVMDDKTIIKQQLGLSSVPDFYLHVSSLIKNEIKNADSATYTGICVLPGNFPSTYQRLLDKTKAYKATGYEYLIDARYGNKSAAKIGKTEEGFDPELEAKQIAVIRTLATHHNNLDAGQIHRVAAPIFEKNGWHMVTDRRISQILQGMSAQITPGRRGKKVYNSEVAMQVKRLAPKHPTYYWTLDGWTAELLYQQDGKYHHRLDIVVVLDAFNKYPIGYAIGDRESPELIRQAVRNAIEHTSQLFGGYYIPGQMQSDNYQIKKLTPFFQAAAELFTPAAVGNAKAKVVEPYFRYLNHDYCQLLPNWSGHNLDSRKENQVNREMQKMIWKSFPDKKGVAQQLHAIMAKERSLKYEAYMQSWELMPPERRNLIEYMGMDWLMVFGQPTERRNQITGPGLIKQIQGQRITYNSFEPAFRQNRHLDWLIVADMNDLSKVLAISPDEKLRFVLHKVTEVAMDIQSQDDEQREYRTAISGYNKERTAEIMQMYGDDAALVNEVLHDTPELDKDSEAILKLMPVYNGQQKKQLQGAKKLLPEAKEQADDRHTAQMDYLKSKININDYL